jgi:beta-N-acetylhexosaminidase
VPAAGRVSMAMELAALGFSMSFAPVLDVATNPSNPIIGDRAFGTTHEEVIHNALPYMQGLAEGGILSCGKHFPGHGDTSVDSHLALPLVEHPPDRIRRVECVPFREAIRNDVAFLMTAHVLVPSFDEEKPATLSPTIVRSLLREELGFGGVILSDDLEMKAIASTYRVPDAAVEAIAAGCDALLICSGNVEVQAAALEELVHAVEQERIPYTRLEATLTRLRRAKERFLAAPVATGRPQQLRHVLGCDAHQRIVDEMARFV